MNRGIPTFDDVVKAGQEGVATRQRATLADIDIQDSRRKQRMQADADAGEQEVGQMYQGFREQGIDHETAMLRAGAVRSKLLAQRGDMRGAMQNDMALYPVALRKRATALRKWEADGDDAAFVKGFYDSWTNGEDVENVEVLPGGAPVDRGTAPTAAKTAPMTMAQVLDKSDSELTNPLGVREDAPPPVVNPGSPGDGRLGAPSGPKVVRAIFKDGQARPVDVQALAKAAKYSLQDPVKAYEQEFELRFKELAEGVKAAAQTRVVEARGKQDRETLGVRSGFENDRLTRKAALDRELAGVNNSAAQRRAETTAGATLQSALIRAGADGDGNGEIKTLAQANRAVETARNALNQATTAATNILLGGEEGKELRGDQRAARVNADSEVLAARAEYQRALQMRNQLAAGRKPGAPSEPAAKPAADRSNQFKVIR